MNLTDIITACGNSHRGGSRALNPKPCGNDWCARCGQPRTDFIIEEAQAKFANTNSPMLFHITIILNPARSFADATNQAKAAIQLIADANIDCIGNVEIGDPLTTPGFVHYRWSHMFMASKHIGIPHLHLLTDQRINVSSDLWNKLGGATPKRINHQIFGKRQPKQTRDDFIAKEMQYSRKRERIMPRAWFKHLDVSDQQVSFKVSYGEVFYLDHSSNSWCNRIKKISGSVVNGSGSVHVSSRLSVQDGSGKVSKLSKQCRESCDCSNSCDSSNSFDRVSGVYTEIEKTQRNTGEKDTSLESKTENTDRQIPLKRTFADILAEVNANDNLRKQNAL